MGRFNREQLLTKKIGVLMGGLSAEREVSFKTGQATLEALIELGYDAVAVDALVQAVACRRGGLRCPCPRPTVGLLVILVLLVRARHADESLWYRTLCR